MPRGNDSLADSVNGRFREFTPNALGGGRISAITSGGTAQGLAFASITGLTPAEYYMRLYVSPDTSNGHYLMVGHDDSAIPETNAGRGELHLADITYNEAGNSATATEYFIGGDSMAGSYVTDGVVVYDPNHDLVAVAYLEGGSTAPVATNLYVRIAERVSGAWVFGTPILITNNAARSPAADGGGYRSMAMELVDAGTQTFLYFSYGPYNAGGSGTFKSAGIRVAKYELSTSGGNQPPVADNDGPYSATEDTPLVVNAATGVLVGDTDTDGPSALTAVNASDPAHGSVTLNTDGSFTYTPDLNWNGTGDTFTYQAYDGADYSNTATVTINVAAVNDAPVADNDGTYNGTEDTPLVVNAATGVLIGDTDVDGPSMTAVNASNPPKGSVTLNTDGSFTYTPDLNTNGTDTFTYQAYDGTLYSNTATVTVNIAAVNDAPVAAADGPYSATQDTPLVVSAPGVLTNDTDVEGSALTAANASDPPHGSVTLNSNGGFTYTPDSLYIGADSFTYQAYDGALYSTAATVSITVAAGGGDEYFIESGGKVTMECEHWDGNSVRTDPSSLVWAEATTYAGYVHTGYITTGSGSNATWANGCETSYQVNFTTTGTYTIWVRRWATGKNYNGVFGGLDGTQSSLTDNQNNNYNTWVWKSLGTISVATAGTKSVQIRRQEATYNADRLYLTNGSDTPSGNGPAESLRGGGGGNQPPVADNDGPYSATEDTPLVVNAATGVLVGDTDTDGPSALTAVNASNPPKGSVTLNTDGSFTYTPDLNTNGTDTFTYQAYDGADYSNTATVTINVAAVNDVPVADNDGTYNGTEDTPLVVNAATGVLIGDTDVDGPSALTAVNASNPPKGSVTLNTDGSFTYTPDLNTNGTDTFTYQAYDGAGYSTAATVTVNMAAVNDAPVANNDSGYSTPVNTPLVVPATGVLANDTDVDGPSMTAVNASNPPNGSVTLNTNGGFTYTPDTDYTGPDSFTYQAYDGSLYSTAATVNITVNPAGGSFTQEIAAADNPTDWTIAGDSTFQLGQNKVGGLGFEVTIGDYPRLYQRGFYDQSNINSGTRSLYRITEYLDLGQFRTGSTAVTPTQVTRNWCYRTHRGGTGSEQLDWTISRVSPAILLDLTTTQTTLDLFSGTKRLGNRWDGANWVFQNSTRVPTWCAYMDNGSVQVHETNATITLGTNMDECWMLFWHGDTTDFFRTNFAGIGGGTTYFSNSLAGLPNPAGPFFTKADVPVLVVFQKRPTQIAPGGDNALRVTFPSGGANVVAVMPLYGNYHPDATVTQPWSSALPTDVRTRCQTWSQRLKWYPLMTSESRSVTGTGSSVSIRHSFAFRDLTPDTWGTTMEKMVPISPTAKLAFDKQTAYIPMTLSGTPLGTYIPTHSGPYTGISGASTSDVTITMTGLNRYVDNMVVNTAASGADAIALKDEVQTLVADMVTQPWPGAWHLSRKGAGYNELHFGLTNDTLITLAEAYPYLASGTPQTNAANYATSEFNRQNPFTQGFPIDPDHALTGREYVRPVTNAIYMALTYAPSNNSWVNRAGADGDILANGAYGVWAVCKATGNWTLADNSWTAISSANGQVNSAAKSQDWANMGKLCSSNMYVGGVNFANARMARHIGHARIAHQRADSDQEQKAIYRLARTAINRFGMGKLIGYMYDEGIIKITGPANWLALLSAGTAEAEAGQLWTDNWDTKDEDARAVTAWNETGPRLYTKESSAFLAVGGGLGDRSPSFPMFENLTPEVGRFLGDNLLAESQAFFNLVAANAPNWHMNNRETYVGTEPGLDSLINPFGMFNAQVYILGGSFVDTLGRYDAAFFRHGDLYQIRRLVANLRCQTGLSWVSAY